MKGSQKPLVGTPPPVFAIDVGFGRRLFWLIATRLSFDFDLDAGYIAISSLLQDQSWTKWLPPLPLETEVKGSILNSYKAGGPFLPLIESEAASLPMVEVGLSTSQPPPYIMEDDIRAHDLSRWLGPYVVKHQYPSGYVELYGKDGKTFIVNGHRLKLYHEEDNDPGEELTPFFPKE
ncbi:hypothetical protein Tco_1314156 [Tanacetum coccineum]